MLKATQDKTRQGVETRRVSRARSRSAGEGGTGKGSKQASQRQVRPSPRKSNKEEDHHEENTGLQNGAPAEHISVLHDTIEDAQGVRGQNGGRGEGELSKVFGHFQMTYMRIR